jgi:hypothetical protein
MLLYFKGRWPDEVVPPREPTWFHFEAETNGDLVLRVVELFDDDRAFRNSLKLMERDGFPCISVVDGPFLEHVSEWRLDPITADEFEALWDRGIDKPFP